MGETDDEVDGCLADLAGIGVDIVTIGQYLRPTSHHLPVARWVEPAEFAEWAALGEALGIGHVEASPLTRSSYHAKAAAEPSRRSPSGSDAISVPAERSSSGEPPVATGGGELALPRSARPGPRGDGRPGRRRAAPLRRPRPAVPDRVRGDAARAADDARRAPRRRRHDGDPRLEAPRVVEQPACSRWPVDETEDPSSSPSCRRCADAAVGDQMWARFLVELIPHLPGAASDGPSTSSDRCARSRTTPRSPP